MHVGMTRSSLLDCLNFNIKQFLNTEYLKIIVEKSPNRRFEILKECYFATGPKMVFQFNLHSDVTFDQDTKQFIMDSFYGVYKHCGKNW